VPSAYATFLEPLVLDQALTDIGVTSSKEDSVRIKRDRRRPKEALCRDDGDSSLRSE